MRKFFISLPPILLLGSWFSLLFLPNWINIPDPWIRIGFGATVGYVCGRLFAYEMTNEKTHELLLEAEKHLKVCQELLNEIESSNKRFVNDILLKTKPVKILKG